MYIFETINREIPEETRLSLSKFFKHELMGEIALEWTELIRTIIEEKEEVLVFKIYKQEKFIGIATILIIRKLDPAKYLWKPIARFLQFFMQFDVGFLEIPLLNRPGLLTIKGIDEYERGNIIYALRQYIEDSLNLNVLFTNVDNSIKSSTKLNCFEGTLPLSFYPNTPLNYPYKNFDEYVKNLPSRKRRKYKADKKALEKLGGTIEIHTDIANIVPQIYALYKNTAREVKKKQNYVEMPITINESFFSNLLFFKHLNPCFVVITVDDVIIADALLVKNGNTLFLKAIGLDYDLSYKTKAYFNLFYATLDYACQQNCDKVDLGTTSYQFKQWLGCKLTPSTYACDIYNPFVHFLGKPLIYLVERQMGTRQYIHLD